MSIKPLLDPRDSDFNSSSCHTPLKSSPRKPTSSFLHSVKQKESSPSQNHNQTLFDEFKSFMKLQIKNKSQAPPKTEKDTDIAIVANSQIEKIIHQKLRLRGIDNYEKFEKKMKVFRILDSYVDVKDYLKKMNLSYNPQMKEILDQRKKKELRQQFHLLFGVDINELEDSLQDSELEPDSIALLQKEHELVLSKAKKTINSLNKYQKKSVLKPKSERSEIEKGLKTYLSATFSTLGGGRLPSDQENDSQSQIFKRIDDYYTDQPQENVPKLSFPRNIKGLGLDLSKSTHYAKEMEKFQNLIENSIDFNLIKKVKNDEEDIPSNFYYMAYQKHAKQIQSILKKTCQKLYHKKLDFIEANKAKLSHRVQEEAEKLKNFINVKIVKKNTEETKIGSHSKNRIRSKMLEGSNGLSSRHVQMQSSITAKTTNSEESIEDFPSSTFRKNNSKFSNKDDGLPRISNNNYNPGINAKFSTLINKINRSQIENADKKLLIEKEIDDIEDVFQKELDLIKIKQFKRVEAIRDFKKEEKVENKFKLIKSYFSNKKKGKCIIKL